MPFLYKNKSDQEQLVIGAGVWQPGEIKESPVKIENPNFELQSQPVQAQGQVAQPAQKEPFAQKGEDK